MLSSFGLMPATAQDTSSIRVAVLKFGTVNWFLDTMAHNQIDTKNGFKLDVLPLASKNATSVAFLSKSVDAFVTDWFWAMAERNKGNQVSFLPYSATLGALLVPPGATTISLDALEGKQIGVAGGPIDKSWLLMQVFARHQGIKDLAKVVSPIYGAPPLLSAQIENGALDGVLTYWHFGARLRAAGYQTVMTVDDAMHGLGIKPAPPLVGFVRPQATNDKKRQRWNSFAKAVQETNTVLATSDEAWERLRGLMKVKSKEEFTTLRDTYRGGIISPWGKKQTDAAGALYALMKKVGGPKVIGADDVFDPSLFPANKDNSQ